MRYGKKKAKYNKIIAKNVLHATAWPVWSDSQTNNSYELLLFSESKQTAYLVQSNSKTNYSFR